MRGTLQKKLLDGCLAKASAITCALTLVVCTPAIWQASAPTNRVTEEEHRTNGPQEEQRHESNGRVLTSLAIERQRAARRQTLLLVRSSSVLHCASMDHRGLAIQSSLPPGADPQREGRNGCGAPLLC